MFKTAVRAFVDFENIYRHEVLTIDCRAYWAYYLLSLSLISSVIAVTVLC